MSVVYFQPLLNFNYSDDVSYFSFKLLVDCNASRLFSVCCINETMCPIFSCQWNIAT